MFAKATFHRAQEALRHAPLGLQSVCFWPISAAADRQLWIGCRRARQTAVFTQPGLEADL